MDGAFNVTIVGAARDAGCALNAPDSPVYPYIVLGGVLSAVADLIVPFGITMQKVGLLAADKGGFSHMRSTAWWIGLFTMVCGELGNLVAYSLAPAQLVSPLGAIGLAGNAFFASLILKEPFTRHIAIAVGVDIFGIVLISIGVPTAGGFRCAVHDEFLTYLSGGAFQAALVLLVCALVTFIFLTRKKGTDFLLFPLMTCGLFGAFTVMTSKSTASMIFGVCLDCCSSCQTPGEMLGTATFWIQAMFLIGPCIMQVRYLNMAMECFDNQLVIPTFYVMFTGCAMFFSAILYQEVDWQAYRTTTGALKGLVFVAGICFTVTGTVLIAKASKKRQVDDHENPTLTRKQDARLADDGESNSDEADAADGAPSQLIGIGMGSPTSRGAASPTRSGISGGSPGPFVGRGTSSPSNSRGAASPARSVVSGVPAWPLSASLPSRGVQRAVTPTLVAATEGGTNSPSAAAIGDRDVEKAPSDNSFPVPPPAVVALDSDADTATPPSEPDDATMPPGQRV